MAGVLDSVNQRTQLVGQNRLELAHVPPQWQPDVWYQCL